MKILEQENSHLHKLLELAEYDSTNTGVVQGNVPNPILNGDGGRGKFESNNFFANKISHSINLDFYFKS